MLDSLISAAQGSTVGILQCLDYMGATREEEERYRVNKSPKTFYEVITNIISLLCMMEAKGLVIKQNETTR